MAKKENATYIIEREYLERITVKELVSRIIESHISKNDWEEAARIALMKVIIYDITFNVGTAVK